MTLGVELYFINLETHQESLEEYLKGRRQSQGVDIVNDFMKKNTFMVTNKFGDVWFWDEEFLPYLSKQEFLEQVYNYYQGVRELHNEHELLITMRETDTHFVCYVEGSLDEEKNIKMKNLRRF